MARYNELENTAQIVSAVLEDLDLNDEFDFHTIEAAVGAAYSLGLGESNLQPKWWSDLDEAYSEYEDWKKDWADESE